jgi:hypothetical protein
LREALADPVTETLERLHDLALIEVQVPRGTRWLIHCLNATE